MMKYTPRVRSEMAPMNSAASAATQSASGQAIQAEVTPAAISRATT